MNPLAPIDLLSLPSELMLNYEAKDRAKEMNKLHEQVKNHIEKTNTAYNARVNKHRKKTEFNLGDLVWLHLRKERFLSRRKNKLMVRRDGPFKIIEKVGDNACNL